MQMKSVPRLLLVIALVSVSVFPQTSDELRRKYKLSSIVESYEVRPGVIAIAFFGQAGQAIQIEIMPGFFDYEMSPKQTISPSVAQELISELVPVQKRGKLCYDNGDQSGPLYYRTIAYENVQISMSERDHKTPKAYVDQIEVRWMKLPCPNAPSNTSLDASGGSVFRKTTGPAMLE